MSGAVDVAWGPNGLRSLLAAEVDAVVVIDVLRFTTAVEVAVAAGAHVYPYRWNDGGAPAYAEEVGAELAVPTEEAGPAHPWSLSPAALRSVPAGTRLVLPSPNGATLAFAAREAGKWPVVGACLRNATAVGNWLAGHPGRRIGVLAAGERWSTRSEGTGPLRPALEDLVGAGAVVAALLEGAGVDGRPEVEASPDAVAAVGAFTALVDRLGWAVATCPSGRELLARGLDDDVAVAAAHDVSSVVPVLEGERFVHARARRDGVRE
jgi:2-phosphosulfolactate phosphatase